LGLALLEEHPDHLLQVLVELIEGFCLGVGTREAGDVPDLETRLRAFLPTAM
jgi:hypothetical protein